MNQYKDITSVLPLEIVLRILSYLNLTELVELSKVNSYYKRLAKIAYIERVINSKLIMEINLGTEQPINIRYECSKFNRDSEQTVWKPTAIIGSKNRRSVNTREKVLLRKVYFEDEPKMTENDNYNLVHTVQGEMDIKDSGIECIKGEENLEELNNLLKKNRKNRKKSSMSKSDKGFKNIFSSKKTYNIPKEENVKAELCSAAPIMSHGSLRSTDSVSSYLSKYNNEGYMENNQCLFFYESDDLIKDTIKWSFEYKVESVSKNEGESWQKLQPSKLRLPVNIFFQNKIDLSTNKKHNYSKYKSIVKKNMLNLLEKFSKSFVGVI